MKNIKNYEAEKYKNESSEESKYQKIEDGIYSITDNDEVMYVTSLSFEQEPEFEEGENADEISQYPLEDVLDEFYCHIADFYSDLNLPESKTCYLEFGAFDLEYIKDLRSIIGKHVYNKDVEEDGELYTELAIE